MLLYEQRGIIGIAKASSPGSPYSVRTDVDCPFMNTQNFLLRRILTRDKGGYEASEALFTELEDACPIKWLQC